MSRYSTTSKQLHGTWVITECQAHTADDANFSSLKGIEFTLERGGSVLWSTENHLDFPPTFCDTYEIHPSPFCIFIRFAGFRGSVIEFRVEKPSHHEMILSFESCIILTCKRVIINHHTHLDFPFSLLPALEDGYFSDFDLCTANGQKIPAHRTILSLSLPKEADWLTDDSKLNGLPESVLSIILHYFYSHTLPSTLSTSTAKLCIEHFQGLPELSNLVELCQKFLTNTALRSELQSLVKSIHTSLERMVSFFDTNDETDAHVNAARLWQSLKLSLGEGVLVVVRFVHLCVTYVKQKNELTAEERQEVLSYFMSRLPVLASQVYRLLKCFKSVMAGLSASQNFDLATYIAPEVDGCLSTIWAIAIECKNIAEQIIYSFRVQPTQQTGYHISDTLLQREILKLKNVHEKLLLTVMFLSHKKENFAEMSVASQVRSVMRNINLVIEEIPLVILRLEDIMASLDESLSSAEFQFTFSIVASKISQMVSRLRDLKNEPNVRALLQQMCDLIQREEFNSSLVALDLLPAQPATSPTATAVPPPTEEAAASDFISGNGELSRFGPLCREPRASRSELARRTLQLLETETHWDLEFILPFETESSGQEQQPGNCVIKAHRVILASRCRWFRQALLSGMREAIDRKITLPDCSPALLNLFLRFLYGDNLDKISISNEQLIDLLILADRFEVEQLSIGCQTVLASRLDCSNVLCLLAVADQWSATQLQESCLNYIWKHGDAIDKEGFDELSPHLKAEIQMHASHSQSSKHHWPKSQLLCNELYRDVWGIGNSDRSSSSRNSSSSSSSSSSKESVDLLQELTNEMRIAVAEAEQEHQEQRLEHCVSALEDILVDVARPELLRLALAADCDVNRAVNYYLAQPDSNIPEACNK